MREKIIMSELPQILDTDQVADYLKCTAKKVREKAVKGDLVGIKVGRDWIFRASDIASFIDTQIDLQKNTAASKSTGSKRKRAPSLT